MVLFFYSFDEAFLYTPPKSFVFCFLTFIDLFHSLIFSPADRMFYDQSF